ncbi:MAG: hypothetical protein MUO57_06735, partial [Anaerolineales bacterium]|nr:hypothetical protein [Anaerolineales bacterium]
VPGLWFAGGGGMSILQYFGQKEKVINLTCKSCEMVSLLDGTLVQSGTAGVASSHGKTGMTPLETSTQSSSELNATPVSPDLAREDLEPCKNCGRLIETFDLTCPHCGHTQWGVIAVMGVLGVLITGYIVYRSVNGGSTGLLFWAGAALGALLLLATVYSLVKAFQRPRTK